MGPVLHGAEELEKARVLDVYFVLVFTRKASLQESLAPKSMRPDGLHSCAEEAV